MSAVNLFRRKRGAAFVHLMGVTFYAADAIAQEFEINPFGVPTDAFGDVGQRYNGRLFKISFTPSGGWIAAALAVLFPFQTYKRGQYNTPLYTVSAVSTATSSLTIPAHGIVDGTGVRVGASTTLPTGLAANTTYYTKKLDANTITLYDTEAHALVGGATGLTALTTVGAGVINLIQNTPLTITWINDGDQLVVWNVGLTKMPGIVGTPVKTLYKQVELEGYTRHGMHWSDENSLYTFAANAGGSDASFNPDDILTVPFDAAWGSPAVAPFDDLNPRDGFEIDPTLSLDPVNDDANGVLCRSISDLSLSAKLRPLNLYTSDLLQVMNLQGAAAGRGKELPYNDLILKGPGSNPYIRMYGAALTNLPLGAATKDDRIGDLTFKTRRTFAAGAPNPVFYVGTSDPNS